jgi:CBS domain-containing protein
MISLEPKRVKEIIPLWLVTVPPSHKMDVVSKELVASDINAAAVVDAGGKCIGIITSHDIMTYESKRLEFQKELHHGRVYDMARYGCGGQVRLPGLYFDEVGFHMSTVLQTAFIDDLVEEVAIKMCAKNIHHVVVVDNVGKPIGMVSSLDILGYAIGVPVCRATHCEDD